MRAGVDLPLSQFRLGWLRALLVNGGVIAYPTEGVFGLGCLASHAAAVDRIVQLKGRSAAKGLILLVADRAQFAGWARVERALPDEGTVSAPLTWIVKSGPLCSSLITGGRPSVAVRVTKHPVARALAAVCPAPLISTSANFSGRPAIVRRAVLARQFGHEVDAIVPGALGDATGPSEIRDLATGKVLRAAQDK